MKKRQLAGAVAALTLLAGLVQAQPTPVAAVPAPPVTTVWHRLGIPQAFVRVRDNTLNRRGNFPGLEKKPPLLRIADPANLDSPNDAIRAAAEVKKEEDLAKQKIKALKYLATIGCGCYDKDKKIEKAILAGLEDCTPEVRMAAINAIVYIVNSCDPQGMYGYSPSCMEKIKKCIDDHCCCDEFHDKLRMMGVGKKVGKLKEGIHNCCPLGNHCNCPQCRSGKSNCSACSGCCGHCCSEKIQARLASMAFEEKNGCYIEPIADIRAAAREALCLCPAPICDEEEEPTPAPEPDPEPALEEGAEGQDEAGEADADGAADPDAETIPSPNSESQEEAEEDLDSALLRLPEGNLLLRSPAQKSEPAPPGLAVSRRAQRRSTKSVQPVAAEPVAAPAKTAKVGVQYEALVEVAGTTEGDTHLVLRDEIAFGEGQRVLCLVDGKPNTSAVVTKGGAGRVAVSLDKRVALRPGASLSLRALTEVVQEPEPFDIDVLFTEAPTPSGIVTVSDTEEPADQLSQPRMVGGWQPRIVR